MERDISWTNFVAASQDVDWRGADIDRHALAASPPVTEFARLVAQVPGRGGQPDRPRSKSSQPASYRQTEYSA